MSNHTPGPWLQSHRRSGRGYSTQVYTGDGQEICTLAWYPMPKANGWTGTYRESNARLIAAAPDLLLALKDAAVFLELEGISIGAAGALEEALRVIAKATEPSA